MSTELRVQVLQACDAYLSSTEEHAHGFCWWASSYLGLDWSDFRPYDLIATCRCEMAGLDECARLPIHVGGNTGRTPERIQFVQDLRDYLLLDI